jgi:hypothetical protein
LLSFPVGDPEHARNGADLVSAVCEACRAKADVNVDAMPDTIAVPKVSPWLRCSRCDGKRVSTRPHGTWPDVGRARLSPGMPVGAPTNGRDSSHLGGTF